MDWIKFILRTPFLRWLLATLVLENILFIKYIFPYVFSELTADFKGDAELAERFLSITMAISLAISDVIIILLFSLMILIENKIKGWWKDWRTNKHDS